VAGHLVLRLFFVVVTKGQHQTLRNNYYDNCVDYAQLHGPKVRDVFILKFL
jgi:hypothetical protein